MLSWLTLVGMLQMVASTATNCNFLSQPLLHERSSEGACSNEMSEQLRGSKTMSSRDTHVQL